MTDAQPRLFAFLLKRLAAKDQAQEVLQNVNLTICKKAHDFMPGTNFMSWAFAIARFELMSFRQKQSREKLVFSDELAEQINMLDVKFTQLHPLEARKQALETCVSRLSAEQQKFLTRRYTESISVKAIAAELGRTTNAVSLMLHRVRDKLLHCINIRLSNEFE